MPLTRGALPTGGSGLIGQVSYFAKNPGSDFVACDGNEIDEIAYPELIQSGMHSFGFSYALDSVSVNSDTTTSVNIGDQQSICKMDDYSVLVGDTGHAALFYVDESGLMQNVALSGLPSYSKNFSFTPGPAGADYDLLIYLYTYSTPVVKIARFKKLTDLSNPVIKLYDTVNTDINPDLATYLIKSIIFDDYLIVCVSQGLSTKPYYSKNFVNFNLGYSMGDKLYNLQKMDKGILITGKSFSWFFKDIYSFFNHTESIKLENFVISPDYEFYGYSYAAKKGGVIAVVGRHYGLSLFDIETLTQTSSYIDVPGTERSIITVEDKFLIVSTSGIYQTTDGSDVTQLMDLSSIKAEYGNTNYAHLEYTAERSELILWYNNLKSAILLDVSRTVTGSLKLTPKMPDAGNAKPYIKAK